MKNIFKNKTVLITGGTGFLGRQLTTNILKQSPKAVRLLSRDEVKHFNTQEFFKYHPKIRNFIGDVRDYPRLKKAMREVDIVIHAAALKRIDLLEYNVEEAIKTNIIGTLNVVNACLANKVKMAVFVSTDKACSPVNTYGACKFVSERIFTESNFSRGNLKTIFTTVRYGNVLESTGSVIPLFIDKIKNGDKIPLTDARMTRFIISPQQSVDLIFKAIKYAKGGEVFVPKLGSFKIVDLIEILKEKYKVKNKVEVVGVRPGEKIHELLINQSEVSRTVSFKDLFIILPFLKKQKQGKKPVYMLKGKKLKNIKNYSSKDNLLSKKEVVDIFKQLGVV